MLGFFCFFEKHHQPPSTTWQTWLVTVFNFLIFFLSKIAAQLFFNSRVTFLTTTISVTGFRRFSSLSTLVMYCWFFDLILFFFFCLFASALFQSSSLTTASSGGFPGCFKYNSYGGWKMGVGPEAWKLTKSLGNIGFSILCLYLRCPTKRYFLNFCYSRKVRKKRN